METLRDCGTPGPCSSSEAHTLLHEIGHAKVYHQPVGIMRWDAPVSATRFDSNTIIKMRQDTGW